MPISNKETLEAIKLWQNNILMHPMTCTCGEMLKPQEEEDRIILVCSSCGPKCDYKQENIPKPVIEAYTDGFLERNRYCSVASCRKELTRDNSVQVTAKVPPKGGVQSLLVCKDCREKYLDPGRTEAVSCGVKSDV